LKKAGKGFFIVIFCVLYGKDLGLSGTFCVVLKGGRGDVIKLNTALLLLGEVLFGLGFVFESERELGEFTIFQARM
jgi:hypothetical protein